MNGLTGVVANLYNAFEPDIRVTSAVSKRFKEDSIQLKKIASIEGVEIISRSLRDKVLIKNIDKQALVNLKGVDVYFNKITAIDSAVTEGAYTINKDKHAVVLGRGIAGQLHVNMNLFSNELSIYSPIRGKTQGLSEADQLNQVYCTPTGVFSLNDDLDQQYAFVNLETAKELFDAKEELTALEIDCAEGKTKQVQAELKELLGKDFIVKNRYELNDVLFKSLETEKLATFFILAFIMVIATFNIIGALTMLIIEKKKDIKTLYSLGADMRLIRNIFMREALLICGVGAAIGLLIGLLVCWIQIKFHLMSFGEDAIVPYYPVELQLADFVRIFAMIMAIGFIAALYPVRVFTKSNLVS